MEIQFHMKKSPGEYLQISLGQSHLYMEYFPPLSPYN